ncbi:glycosyltransferase family 2 protein [Mariniflexile jejuense]|uniref:Glycosyltransferase family 2 protein n=1 Tax=Mariniflexile jejuense TaxID=1173582 RepID=A0ABW3JJF1_9FLAO
MNPLLSIITATYNSEKTLEKTIKSVLSQNYSNYEYIIVDGKSNDNTINIIKKYEVIFKERNISFKWISEKDTGIYNAWNKGLKLATGNWIAFLGSDDIYLDNAFSMYATELLNNPEADFVHSKVRLVNKGKIKYIVSDKWIWKNFKRYMKIAHVGSFHNSNYFEKYGMYNEIYKIAGDYEMLLRAKSKLKTIFIDCFTAEMEDGGVSNNNVFLVFREVRKAKINTAKTFTPIAYFDFYFSLIKYYISSFLK